MNLNIEIFKEEIELQKDINSIFQELFDENFNPHIQITKEICEIKNGLSIYKFANAPLDMNAITNKEFLENQTRSDKYTHLELLLKLYKSSKENSLYKKIYLTVSFEVKIDNLTHTKIDDYIGYLDKKKYFINLVEECSKRLDFELFDISDTNNKVYVRFQLLEQIPSTIFQKYLIPSYNAKIANLYKTYNVR